MAIKNGRVVHDPDAYAALNARWTSPDAMVVATCGGSMGGGICLPCDRGHHGYFVVNGVCSQCSPLVNAIALPCDHDDVRSPYCLVNICPRCGCGSNNPTTISGGTA
jgi:hypothetical protein